MTAVAVPLAASDATSDALSGISAALEVPVHLAAITVLALLAFELGRLAMEAWRRVRPGSDDVERIATAALAAPDRANEIARAAPGPLTERALLDLADASRRGGGEATEHALADYELRIQRRLDRTRVLVRAGPAIGLMGTLIPLAPGLSALGDGDYKLLAGDLQTAFAATVVGMLVGTTAYAVTLARTRIYTEYLSGLERAVAASSPGAEHHQRVETTVGGEVAA